MRVYRSRQQAEISRLFVSKFLSGPYYTDLPLSYNKESCTWRN